MLFIKNNVFSYTKVEEIGIKIIQKKKKVKMWNDWLIFWLNILLKISGIIKWSFQLQSEESQRNQSKMLKKKHLEKLFIKAIRYGLSIEWRNS